MTKQITTHVRHCLICASTKRGGALQAHAPLRPNPPTRPWKVLSIDVMGPWAETRRKNRFLLVVTDVFSKWVELHAAPRVTSSTVVNFLRTICARWGYPETIITDNGPQFRGATWERFLATNHITGYVTPIYHQRANPVERRNQEIKKVLRTQLTDRQENRWDEKLNDVTFILHNRRNAATGQTPSELLLGAPLARPGEWRHPFHRRRVENDARARAARIRRARERQIVFQRNLFPEPRQAPVHYRVGDLVLVRSFPGVHTPLGRTWEGPYVVLEVRGDNTYAIDRNGVQSIVHVDDIRRAPRREPVRLPRHDPVVHPPPDGDGDDDDDDQPGPPPAAAPDDAQSGQSDDEEDIELAHFQSIPGPHVTIEDVPDDEEVVHPLGQPTHIPIVGLWP